MALIGRAAPPAAVFREFSQCVGKGFNFGIGSGRKPAEETNR
jgi:hypothetical protein